MEMGPLQIASEYRTGKNKTKTIQALAELNACTQRQIAQILQEQGEELPGHWKEKLAKGLKSEPVSDRYLRKAIVEAVTPDTSSGAGATPRSALLSPGKPVPDSFPDGESPQGEGRGAALSLDEIRQAALHLIADRCSSMEPARCQGMVVGIAALIEELEAKLEK